MIQTISVREIAKRIQRPGETLQTTIDRVRNWTKEGLLSLEGSKRPGTGRALAYAKDALLEAALLDILNDAGIAAARAAPFLRLLLKVTDKYWQGTGLFDVSPLPMKAKPKRHKRRPADVPLLVIGKAVGHAELQVADVRLEDLASYLNSARRNTYTVVDLELLFDRLLLPPKE